MFVWFGGCWLFCCVCVLRFGLWDAVYGWWIDFAVIVVDNGRIIEST